MFRFLSLSLSSFMSHARAPAHFVPPRARANFKLSPRAHRTRYTAAPRKFRDKTSSAVGCRGSRCRRRARLKQAPRATGMTGRVSVHSETKQDRSSLCYAEFLHSLPFTRICSAVFIAVSLPLLYPRHDAINAPKTNPIKYHQTGKMVSRSAGWSELRSIPIEQAFDLPTSINELSLAH